MAKAKKNSSPTISTSTLVTEVAAKFDAIPKKMTKEVILTFLTAIEEGVASGNNKVRIDKLGILQVKDRTARKGRNPQTGEEIKIEASKKVAFRVASSLKERIGIKTKKVAATKTSTTKPAPKKKKTA
jgi:DNA-binding protein HU-beta